MTRQNRYFVWLQLTVITAAMLFAAMPSSAQQITRFGGHSHSTNASGTNHNGRSAFVSVSQDPSGVPTSLFYFVMWSVGSVNYEQHGFGNIPNNAVRFVASSTVSLKVDLSTVSGFFSELCVLDSNSGNFMCSAAQAPVITMNLHRNHLMMDVSNTEETFKFASGSTFHASFSEDSNSAAGSASIADQSFPNMSGSIGVLRSRGITVTTRGR